MFEVDYQGIDYLWRTAREAAKLGHVRFKDLRAQFAIAAERAGVPQTVTSAMMGHSDEAMTRRYQRHSAVATADQVHGIEDTLLAA